MLPTTTDYADLFARTRAGDRGARNELLTALHDRILRLTAVVLPGFPAVRHTRGLHSLVNDLFVKLIRALDAGLASDTADDFLRFTGARLRTLLIDEAKKHRRRAKRPPGGIDVPPGVAADPAAGLPFEVPGPDLDPLPLAIQAEDWAGLLDRTARLLDADERSVVEQHLLLGVPQARIAAALGWPPKLVSRVWLRALDKLLPGDTAA